ncbi:PadR family transcriptional regulator [Umezawaea tangerina]|uniref:PadR family transcriptional regulator n=2 Tax=Umezawaea tangerina TaxID=84725 RepID=A0A2T0TCA3_9PSEU|nr:PadR family transcriptional regulator [Umezawaea tangerina]
MTPQTIAVLRVLLEDATTPRYGLDIARQAGLKTGTLHPILARLQEAGWIESYWEDPADHEDQGRPRRRYYRFTGSGATAACQAIARAEATATTGRPLGLHPQPGH